MLSNTFASQTTGLFRQWDGNVWGCSGGYSGLEEAGFPVDGGKLMEAEIAQKVLKVAWQQQEQMSSREIHQERNGEKLWLFQRPKWIIL